MERIEDFLDVRQSQERLEGAGIEITTAIDPDGNQVLIDQFF